MFRLQVI